MACKYNINRGEDHGHIIRATYRVGRVKSNNGGKRKWLRRESELLSSLGIDEVVADQHIQTADTIGRTQVFAPIRDGGRGTIVR